MRRISLYFPCRSGILPQRRVRPRLPPPPPSLLLQRLRAFIQEQIEKFTRFRGVLAVGLSRTRTGDGGIGASKAQQPAFFSVGKLGGSDSLQIRLSDGLVAAVLDAARTSVDVNVV